MPRVLGTGRALCRVRDEAFWPATSFLVDNGLLVMLPSWQGVDTSPATDRYITGAVNKLWLQTNAVTKYHSRGRGTQRETKHQSERRLRAPSDMVMCKRLIFVSPLQIELIDATKVSESSVTRFCQLALRKQTLLSIACSTMETAQEPGWDGRRDN